MVTLQVKLQKIAYPALLHRRKRSDILLDVWFDFNLILFFLTVQKY